MRDPQLLLSFSRTRSTFSGLHLPSLNAAESLDSGKIGEIWLSLRGFRLTHFSNRPGIGEYICVDLSIGKYLRRSKG